MNYYNPDSIKELTEGVKGFSSTLAHISLYRGIELKNEAFTPELASAYTELLDEMRKCIKDYEKNFDIPSKRLKINF